MYVSQGPTRHVHARYCSPEVDAGRSRTSSSDVFSLATVFLAMVARLNGETVENLRAFLDGEGEGDSEYYCRCVPGIEAWLRERIRGRPGAAQVDKVPVRWILPCLVAEEQTGPSPVDLVEDRPSAADPRRRNPASSQSLAQSN